MAAASFFLSVVLPLCLCGVDTALSKEIYLLTEVSSLERPERSVSQEVITYFNCAYNSSGYSIHPIKINSSWCHPINGHCLLQAFIQNVQLFYDSLQPLHDNLAGVITTRYHIDSGIISALLSHMNITIPLIYGSLVSSTSTGVFYMYSSSTVIVDAFLQLSKRLNWSRMGVISDDSDTYFSETTIFLLKKENNLTIYPYLDVGETENIDELVKHIISLNTKVIFLSANCYKTYQILHTAHLNHLTWPEYAWIAHSIHRHELLQCNSTHSLGSKPFEGVIFINQDLTTNSSHESSSEACREKGRFSDSTQFKILRDAVHTVVNAVASNFSADIIKNTLQTDFLGATGRIKFTNNQVERNIKITQMKNNRENLIAYYHRNSFTLEIIDKTLLLGTIPDDSPLLTKRPQLPIWYVTTEVSIMVIFVTIILVMYLYYRNCPEIKATSVPLSILIFIGCYLLLFFLILILIESNFEHDAMYANICIPILWLSGIGFPIPLIFATLLVKMLRIYHIFNTFGKASKLSSDLSLLLFVLLILSPNILILIVFSSLGSYRLQAIYEVKTGYIETGQGCQGDSNFITSVHTTPHAVSCSRRN